MKSDLSEQVALVTGSSRGIGLAIADRFAANGATVIYSDIDTKQLQQTTAERDGAIGYELDVTNRQQVQKTVHDIVERFGHLDLLVNNAGVNTLKHRVTVDEFPHDEWDRIVAVDLNGVYNMSHEVTKVMRKQGAGRVINIASIAGIVPLRLQCAFTAAKGGVVNFTRAMAIELGKDGILVNGIAPGSTLTAGTEDLFYGADGKFKDNVQKLLNSIPLGRPGSTDEIAVAALFLADPENSYMNGQILTVDGGWTAGYHRDF